MFHTTYRVKDSRMVTAGEERSDAAEVTTLWLHGLAMLPRSEAALTWNRFEA